MSLTVFLFFRHFPVLLGHPRPGVYTAENQADDQERECPGMPPGMVTVQPDTECGAGERRNHHRPADEPHHPQAKPDALRGVAPGTELEGSPGADLPAERRPVFRGREVRRVTHARTRPDDG